MFGKVVEYFFDKPTRLIELGRTVSFIGMFLVLTGLLGQVATTTTTTTVISGLGKSVTEKTLAEIYPTLPTWWIPETLIGGLLAIVIFALGVWLVFVGKQLKRFIEH